MSGPLKPQDRVIVALDVKNIRGFLDLKFYDIPSTVGRAVQAATRLGIWMTNLHIQGGSSMMRHALAAAGEESARLKRKPPLLIGVTVLTSMAERDLADLGVRKTLSVELNGIVVGRPIWEAVDPAQAAKEIVEKLQEGPKG